MTGFFSFRRGGRLSLAIVLILAAAPALLPGQVESVGLRLRWEPGRVYTQETITETTTALTAIGQASDQKMKVKQTTQVEVTAPNPGEKEARVTFAAISGEIQTQGHTQVFDSADMTTVDPAIRESLGKSVGTSFVLVYGQDESFLRVRDSADMVKAKDGNPSLEGIAEAQEVADLYRRSLEMGLPKTKVKPGDGWTYEEEVKFPSAGAVKSELRGRFEAIVEYRGRRHAKISFEGDLKSSGAGSVSGVALAAGSRTLGQILFDIEGGTVSFAAFRAEVILDVQGKRLPVRQQVTTRLVSVEPPL